MTRHAGQLTTRQAVLGGLAILTIVIGIVAALTLLLERDEQVQPLEAPAEPVDSRPCPAAADDRVLVASDQLIECPDVFDGQVVRYRGEAVRAVLYRGDRAWVHLNDDPYALDLGPLPAHRTAVGGNAGVPVSIPAHVADHITHVGDARHQGDILDVTGTYHRSDPLDDGGPAIRARTVRIHRPGHPVTRPTSPVRIITAAAVAGLAVLAAAGARHRPTTTRRQDDR